MLFIARTRGDVASEMIIDATLDILDSNDQKSRKPPVLPLPQNSIKPVFKEEPKVEVQVKKEKRDKSEDIVVKEQKVYFKEEKEMAGSREKSQKPKKSNSKVDEPKKKETSKADDNNLKPNGRKDQIDKQLAELNSHRIDLNAQEKKLVFSSSDEEEVKKKRNLSKEKVKQVENESDYEDIDDSMEDGEGEEEESDDESFNAAEFYEKFKHMENVGLDEINESYLHDVRDVAERSFQKKYVFSRLEQNEKLQESPKKSPIPDAQLQTKFPNNKEKVIKIPKTRLTKKETSKMNELLAKLNGKNDKAFIKNIEEQVDRILFHYMTPEEVKKHQEIENQKYMERKNGNGPSTNPGKTRGPKKEKYKHERNRKAKFQEVNLDSNPKSIQKQKPKGLQKQRSKYEQNEDLMTNIANEMYNLDQEEKKSKQKQKNQPDQNQYTTPAPAKVNKTKKTKSKQNGLVQEMYRDLEAEQNQENQELYYSTLLIKSQQENPFYEENFESDPTLAFPKPQTPDSVELEISENQPLLDSESLPSQKLPPIKNKIPSSDKSPFLKISHISPGFTYKYIPGLGKDFEEAFEYLVTKKQIGFDTEFINKDGDLLATYIQFATIERGYVFNLHKDDKYQPRFKEAFKSIVSNKDIKKIGFNVKNDKAAIMRVFNNDDIECLGFVGIEELLFTIPSATIGLSDLCRRYYGKPLDKGAQTEIAKIEELEDEELVEYAVMDALVPITLFRELKSVIESRPVDNLILTDQFHPNDIDFLLDQSCRSLKPLLQRTEIGNFIIDKMTYEGSV